MKTAPQLRGEIRLLTSAPTGLAAVDVTPLTDDQRATYPALAGYTLHGLIGAGNYGTVLLATQAQTQQLVAIKWVKVSDDARRMERFRRETRLCSALRHPHIVQLLDEGESAPYVYGVFEYVPGISLRQLLQRNGPLDAPEAARLMTQVLDALACAHRLGIVHRDLKPENIMLATYGVVMQAKILDFGISTVVPDLQGNDFRNITLASECLGTPAYAAPEQLRGEPASVQSDLYSWGLIFLECLTGQPAVVGASYPEVFHQQLSPQDVLLPKAVSAHALGDVLRKTVRKNLADRSASAQEVLAELTRVRLDDLVGTLQPVQPLAFMSLAATQEHERPFDEKRQVTLLCCGVSAWYQTQSGADPAQDFEKQEALQRETTRLFQDMALRRGGILVGSLGHRFIVMYGYPQASEWDARHAAMTAADVLHLMRQRQAARADVAIDIRVGLHTGMVVVSGREVSPGHALNTVMQMESAAQPGEVLVSTASRQRLRGFARFEVGPALKAPGNPQGLPSFRLMAEDRRVVDAMAAGDSWHPTCIGRGRELRTLLRDWRTVRADTGRAWLLRGEAGVGKSCLTEAVRRYVAGRGALTLRARCFPENENSALAPLLALIRHSVSDGVALPPDVLVDKLASALTAAGCDTERLLPIYCTWLALPHGHRTPSAISPALQRSLLVQSSVQWLLHQARQAPLLLLVEDLHWADSATVEWLMQLAQGLPGEKILLVLTSRPEWVAPEGLQVRSMDVQRLPSTNAAAMVRHVLAPRQLAPAVVENIVRRTDGVALFIQELSHMLLETSLVERNGVWDFKNDVHADMVPITLRESLNSRFEQLGPARGVLQMAAILGRVVDVRLLHASQPGALADAMHERLQVLEDAGLLVPDDARQQYFFRHALIRDAAYDGMLASQRSRQHAVVAEAMERIDPQVVDQEPGRLAHHYAAAGQFERAAPLGIAQLRLTQHRSLNDETIAYAEQVDAWVAHLQGTARSEAQLELNGYLTQALMNKHGWAHGQVAQRIALSESILAQGISPTLQVQHLWSMITYHHVASNRAETMRLSRRLKALAERMEDSGVQVAALTWIGLAHFSEGDFEASDAALSAAIAQHCTQAHAQHAAYFGFDTLMWAKAARALVRWGTGYDQAAQQDADDAVARARHIAHVPSMGIALLYQALGYQGRGDKPRALAVVNELIDLASRYGLPAFMGYAVIIRAWATDDVAVADGAIGALWGMGCRYCQTYYRAFAAQTLADQGQWSVAMARLDECLALVEQLHEGLYTAELWLQKARYSIMLGGPATSIIQALRNAAHIAQQGGKCRPEAQALQLLSERYPEAAPDASQRLRVLLEKRPELGTVFVSTN
jgi:TOMM system kinase/cyclase fusion protein